MKLDIKKIKEFILTNYKYIILAGLFIALIIVLVALMSSPEDKGKNKGDSITDEQVSDTLEVDAYPDVNALVTKYLSAWAASDVDMLATLVKPLDKEAELQEIALNKDYIESMNNIKCYTKPGPIEESYIVYAYYEMKFNDAETCAPGLVNLFVFKEDKELFIWDYKDYIVAGDDVTGLLSDVNAKYDEVLASDAKLSAQIKALSEGKPYQPTTTAAPQTTAPQTTTPSQTTAPQTTTQPPTQAAANDKVYVESNVNVRSGASTSADKLGVIVSGKDYTRTGQEGEWSIIDYNGKKGYVKTEFLKVR